MGQRCSLPGASAAGSGGAQGKPPTLGADACMCRGSELRLGCPAGVDEQEATIGTVFGADVDGRGGGTRWADIKAQLEALSPTETAQVENMIIPHGGSYTGQVRSDGQPEGMGVQRWVDGTVYSGSWVAGAAHGQGKLSKADGSGFDGQWVEGRKQGAGSEWLTDLSEYTGDFADGQKHGTGTFRWHGGASYEGDFCEDALHGEGTFTWDDGRQYGGQWVLSRMHGNGHFEWPDGRVFSGRYEADKKHGPGVFTWADGSKCVGVWVAGKQHGLGTHVSSKGVPRKGRWNQGSLDTWFDAPPKANQPKSGDLALPDQDLDAEIVRSER